MGKELKSIHPLAQMARDREAYRAKLTEYNMIIRDLGREIINLNFKIRSWEDIARVVNTPDKRISEVGQAFYFTMDLSKICLKLHKNPTNENYLAQFEQLKRTGKTLGELEAKGLID